MGFLVTRVLIAGIPRSGTTWVGHTLRHAPGVAYLHEPDNEVNDPFAVKAKRLLGRYPVLDPVDTAPEDYYRLWDVAFSKEDIATSRAGIHNARRLVARRVLRGVPRWKPSYPFPSHDVRVPARLRVAAAVGVPRAAPAVGEQVVIKSVLAPLALEWVHEHWRPSVAIILRHPLNVVASWMKLPYPHTRLYDNPQIVRKYVEPWNLQPPKTSASYVTRVAWEIGLLTCVLEDAADRHPDWRVFTHESLCADPLAEFRRLCDGIDLEWSTDVEVFICESNRPGTYFVPNRLRGELPEAWRHLLTDDDRRAAVGVLKRLPLRRWDFG
jgi:hypothetical protein